MKTIKTYEDFVNEEINLKKALATGALAAGMAFSNPAISQTINQPTQTSVDMIPTQSDRLPKSFSENHIKDIKVSGWENLKWGDSIETVKEKIPECKPYNQMIGSSEITLKVDGYEINGVDFSVFFIFNDSKQLKSVLLKNESTISQIRSFQEYFNSNYWEGYKSENNKITWNGEMGDINVSEGTYQLPNSTTPNYNLTITYSKSENKAPVVSMTDAQKFDMLRNELIKMKDEQTEVKLNLYKCHKEFKVGVGLVSAGVGLGILGTALLNNPSAPGKEIAIIGSVLSLAGSIVIIDSHKFIAKASLTGIKVEFGGKPSYKKVQPGDYFLYMGPGN